MKEYVMLLLIMGMVSTIVTILSPEGERGGIGKLVRFATGVCLIAVCVSPMASFLERLSHFDLSEILPSEEKTGVEYESVLENGYLYAEVENTREGIKELLNERFEIDASEVDVSMKLTAEDGSRRIERILITLYGQAIWKDTRAIEEYLGGLFGCEVITAIG